ncbi:MAG: PilZ domain-containing protein [Acidobacteria bacterium]|jgi:hypothetical protein|nr:PilZ domain-containing protein [Acidobacteriota bacterium]
MQFVAKAYEKARRSTRIRAQIPVRVTSQDPADPYSENCYTVVVNLQGCGVRLNHALQPGTPVHLDQLPTGAEVNGRVANCVALGTEGKYWLVGIAFAASGNIWGLHPVPADWGMPARPAVAAPAHGAAKPQGWPYNLFSSRGEAHPGKK